VQWSFRLTRSPPSNFLVRQRVEEVGIWPCNEAQRTKDTIKKKQPRRHKEDNDADIRWKQKERRKRKAHKLWAVSRETGKDTHRMRFFLNGWKGWGRAQKTAASYLPTPLVIKN